MKTVRDILYDYNLIGDKTYGLGYKETQELLKELEEVLLASLPKEKEPVISAFKAVPKSQMLEARNNTIYNQALEDTRKAIKELMK